jgi:hypothetical protein
LFVFLNASVVVPYSSFDAEPSGGLRQTHEEQFENQF